MFETLQIMVKAIVYCLSTYYLFYLKSSKQITMSHPTCRSCGCGVIHVVLDHGNLQIRLLDFSQSCSKFFYFTFVVVLIIKIKFTVFPLQSICCEILWQLFQEHGLMGK